MFDSELHVGIAYALLAGILWGVGPLLLKRALKHTNVSTATLLEQNVSVLLLVGLATYSGEIREIDFTSRAFWAFFLAGAVGASFGKVFYYGSTGISVENWTCIHRNPSRAKFKNTVLRLANFCRAGYMTSVCGTRHTNAKKKRRSQ